MEKQQFSTIFLDMDEVLTDFSGGVARLFDVPRDQVNGVWYLPDRLGVSLDEFWDTIHGEGEGFWVELDEQPWFSDLICLCEQYCEELVVLSSPSNHHSSFSGKVQWLKKRFGYGHRGFCLYGRKELFAAKGRLLIDDRPENCRDFYNAGGSSLVFPAHHNSLSACVGNLKVLEHWIEERVTDGVHV